MVAAKFVAIYPPSVDELERTLHEFDAEPDGARRERSGGGVELRLLGPVQAWSAGRRLVLGVRKQRLVLAVLALEANGLVPVRRLVQLLWDQAPPPSARAMVHTHISRLRSILSAADASSAGVTLVREGSAYTLRCMPSLVDAHRFRGLVARARDETDDVRQVGLLEQALALWRGPALADVADELLRERLCRGLHEERLSAVENRFDALLRLGRHDGLVAELTEQETEYPRRPRLVGQLMLALHHGGRTQDALDVYEQARQHSVEHLGLDLTGDLRRLQVAILRDDPLLATPPTRRGQVYVPEQALDVTGRESEQNQLTGWAR